ncbi:hypothetical protein [Gimesia alba]|nr:hypothetical protein [Gimesia alba]
MRKIKRYLLTMSLLCSLMTLGACNQNPATEKAGTPEVKGTDIGSKSAVNSEIKPADTTASQDHTDKITMTTGQGKTMELTLQTLSDSRDYLYCELVFDYGDAGNDIYSTSPLGQGKLEWWDDLDLEALAEEFGAKSVYKNGPQWWSMDEVGVMASQPVKVAGVNMVFGAHLPPGTMNIQKYTVFNPAKFQNLVWEAGKPVYQIVDAEGHVYILQGYKVPTEELATLGERFKRLPDGWEYRVNVLKENLMMKLTPREPIPSVQDEFNQIYIRISKSK